MAAAAPATTPTGTVTPKMEKRSSRMSIQPMPVHPSFQPVGYNPPGQFRTFGNPIPLGLTAHALGCLVYGSYLANWRAVGTPLLISALCLAVCAPGSFLAVILCYISNETFFSITFLAISGLWGMLGLAYLPITGILEFYTATPEAGNALADSIAIMMIWFGVVAIFLGFIVARRNVVFPVILLASGVALFITAAAYFKHQVSTSGLSKASGYMLIVAGVACAHYIIASACAAERFPIQLPLGHFVDPHAITAGERETFHAQHLGQRYPAFHTAGGKSSEGSE